MFDFEFTNMKGSTMYNWAYVLYPHIAPFSRLLLLLYISHSTASHTHLNLLCARSKVLLSCTQLALLSRDRRAILRTYTRICDRERGKISAPLLLFCTRLLGPEKNCQPTSWTVSHRLSSRSDIPANTHNRLHVNTHKHTHTIAVCFEWIGNFSSSSFVCGLGLVRVLCEWCVCFGGSKSLWYFCVNVMRVWL